MWRVGATRRGVGEVRKKARGWRAGATRRGVGEVGRKARVWRAGATRRGVGGGGGGWEGLWGRGRRHKKGYKRVRSV